MKFYDGSMQIADRWRKQSLEKEFIDQQNLYFKTVFNPLIQLLYLQKFCTKNPAIYL